MNRELGAGVSEPTLPVRLESDRNRSSRPWPRANWKGFLRLSLVTCPVALYPATSDSEKISFNQINGGVAELVGIEGGVVSGVTNLESSGVEASDWRPRHDEQYHEA